MKLNEYIIPNCKTLKTFKLALHDDNNAFRVENQSGKNFSFTLFVLEDMKKEIHQNTFRFIKLGEEIDEDWMYINKIGDLFLFQKSSWER